MLVIKREEERKQSKGHGAKGGEARRYEAGRQTDRQAGGGFVTEPRDDLRTQVPL